MILGEAVPKAGPAVLVSFVLAAITCLFSALSYAELAGTIPVSGSSYSYTYATLGELVAWVCGWCLMLEYGVSVAAVAVGLGPVPQRVPRDVRPADPAASSRTRRARTAACSTSRRSLVVLLCGFLLLRGTSESATANTIMVFLKIGILAFFCVVAFTAFDGSNLTPFAPLGHRRHPGGRGPGLLLLHRLRRGVDRRRGGQEPAARPADRDPA